MSGVVEDGTSWAQWDGEPGRGERNQIPPRQLSLPQAGYPFVAVFPKCPSKGDAGVSSDSSKYDEGQLLGSGGQYDGTYRRCACMTRRK